jgi:hypothetical protein
VKRALKEVSRLVRRIDGVATLRMLQVPELKRAMGLTHLKDHRGEGIKFDLDHGTRRDKIKGSGQRGVRTGHACCRRIPDGWRKRRCA